MEVNLSIKGVPAELAERLRQRAERNHRSLQGELMAIIEHAAFQSLPGEVQGQAAQPQAPAPAAKTVKQGWKTIDELIAERRARPLNTTPGLPRAVDIIRADRDSR
jgi:plasmid stability protein